MYCVHDAIKEWRNCQMELKRNSRKCPLWYLPDSCYSRCSSKDAKSTPNTGAIITILLKHSDDEFVNVVSLHNALKLRQFDSSLSFYFGYCCVGWLSAQLVLQLCSSSWVLSGSIINGSTLARARQLRERDIRARARAGCMNLPLPSRPSVGAKWRRYI